MPIFSTNDASQELWMPVSFMRSLITTGDCLFCWYLLMNFDRQNRCISDFSFQNFAHNWWKPLVLTQCYQSEWPNGDYKTLFKIWNCAESIFKWLNCDVCVVYFGIDGVNYTEIYDSISSLINSYLLF